ncbi:alpha/beta fold hydrolase [Leptospira perolatii]|uniref:alpha/beta fold hydrolase n=1 Tax=Leptospira perolatii TaxID=2023191 RepID=UPI001A9C8499|nr:alpha/beta fold hydrolase [Leptospira perolatii]
MKLAFRFYPKKDGATTILILHGLFGSSKNWVSVAEYLTKYGDVYSLDLRNHGDSPHSSDHSLPQLAEDVLEFLNDREIENCTILGHSMGGMVAMAFALDYPTRVNKLIIEDIAPRNYEFNYQNEISALKVDVSLAKSRQEIDQEMSRFVTDSFIRNFLQMNLERKEDGGYKWKLNVEGIANSTRMFESVFHEGKKPFSAPAFFIVGGASEYFQEGDKAVAQKYFPNAKFIRIENADHYMHFTKAEKFRNAIDSILDQ